MANNGHLLVSLNTNCMSKNQKMAKKGHLMAQKNTLLSRQDSELLEQSVLERGDIATAQELDKIFGQIYARKDVRARRISLLAKAGWLVRIKQGLYLIVTDLSSRTAGNVSNLVISNTLNKESYISFASALNWYGMFDQLTKSVDAVTTTRARNYRFQNMEFRFFTVKEKLFFGFTKERTDGKVVNIAEKEKIILDYLSLRRNAATVSLVFEKFKEHKDAFDFSKMISYAQAYSLTIQRNLGFLLDTIDVSSDALCEIVRKNKIGFSKMTATSETFNAKWRLYYDAGIIK
jgi:predicted transcriptional regulator of viral defense system